MAYAQLFDVTAPADSSAASLLGSAIRLGVKTAIIERIDSIFGTSAGTSFGTADPYLPTTLKLTSRLAVGSSALLSGNVGIYLDARTLAGADQYGLFSQIIFNSTATSSATGVYTQVSTVAAAFNMVNAYALYDDSGSKGLGSTKTNQYGLYIRNQVLGGTSNYAVWTNAGLVRFGDAVTMTSTLAVTGVTTLLDSLYFSGVTATFTAPAINGQGRVGVVSAVSGCSVIGKGSTYDVVLMNAVGTIALGILTGTQNIATLGTINGQTISAAANFTGSLAVTTSITSPLFIGAGVVPTIGEIRLQNNGAGLVWRNATNTLDLVGIYMSNIDTLNVGFGCDIQIQGGSGRIGFFGTTPVIKSVTWANQTAAPSKIDLGSAPTVGQLASWASAVTASLKAYGLFG